MAFGRLVFAIRCVKNIESSQRHTVLRMEAFAEKCRILCAFLLRHCSFNHNYFSVVMSRTNICLAKCLACMLPRQLTCMPQFVQLAEKIDNKNRNTVSPELFWWGGDILTFRADNELMYRYGSYITEEPQHEGMCICFAFLIALFNSTYLFESAFSHMKIITSVPP